jgi:hypothetical protein
MKENEEFNIGRKADGTTTSINEERNDPNHGLPMPGLDNKYMNYKIYIWEFKFKRAAVIRAILVAYDGTLFALSLVYTQANPGLRVFIAF